MNQKSWPWWRNKTIHLQDFRQLLQKKLSQNGDEFASNTSLLLISHVLNQPKSWVIAHGEYNIPSNFEDELNNLLEQYLQGIPLPYLLGYWEFFGRMFIITPEVLIPRPETELLVEKAIQRAQLFQKPKIVDVGTGSGIIAISLAAALKGFMMIATDLSRPALKIAQRNAQLLDQSQINFVQSDLLTPFKAEFDLICANLPYIPSQTLASLKVAKWEPHIALEGGVDGMAAITSLLFQAREKLASPGVILLEIEASLGKAVLDISRRVFPAAQHTLFQDYSGHDRLIEIFQP